MVHLYSFLCICVAPPLRFTYSKESAAVTTVAMETCGVSEEQALNRTEKEQRKKEERQTERRKRGTGN